MDGTSVPGPAGSEAGRARNISELTDIVVSHICELDAPVLLIEEADKLRPSVLRSLIPIYNRTRGHLGCILAGTENPEKEIKTGVRCNKKGYDEPDSRPGGTYIRSQGASEKDVYAICEANGVNDEAAQAEIWNQLEKSMKVVKVRTRDGATAEKKVVFAEDFWRIERLIRREKIVNQL